MQFTIRIEQNNVYETIKMKKKEIKKSNSRHEVVSTAVAAHTGKREKNEEIYVKITM